MDYWSQFEELLLPQLKADDDPALWQAVIDLVFHEATFLARCSSDTALVSAAVGCCSHWLRPHQTRWTADGGFAWPSGYGGHGYSRTGQPEHDWTIELYWNANHQLWLNSEPDTHRLEHHTFRLTVPARTSRHMQAAIPAVWSSGTPVIPRKPVHQMYGFRKIGTAWNCKATNQAGADHYELAAEHPRNKTG